MALVEIPDHLYEDVEQLIKDRGAKNAPDNKDIDALVAESPEEYIEYWGETVTVKRNWQSSPDHPKTFLAYITVAEAKMLRAMGLGYSEIDGEYRQHYDKDGIPSFNGWGEGDSDYGGEQQSAEDAAGTSATGSTGSNGKTGAENAAAAEAAAAAGADGFEDLEAKLNALDLLAAGVPELNANEKATLNDGGGYTIEAPDYSYTVNEDGVVTDAKGVSVADEYGYKAYESVYKKNLVGSTTKHTTTVGGMKVAGSTSYEAFGLGWGTDQHFNSAGQELGLFDGFVADVLELMTVDITVEVADAIQSTTTVGLMAIGGMPATVLGKLGLLSASIQAMADWGVLGGLVDPSTRNQIKGVTAAIGLFTGLVTTAQTLQSVYTAKSYGMVSGLEAGLFTAIAAIGLGVQVKNFQSTMDALGIATTPSVYDAQAFTRSLTGMESGDRFDSDGNLEAGIGDFLDWYAEMVDIRGVDMNSVQSDPFAFMAGGSKYDITLAGSIAYHPSNRVVSNTGVTMELDIDAHARRALLQENALNRNLLPLKGTTSSTDITAAGLRAQAISYNAALREYEESVSTSVSLSLSDMLN